MIIGLLIGFLIMASAAFLGYVKTSLPNVGDARQMSVQITPERLQRGKYLAENVAVCIDCHSTRDWTKFALPFVAGTTGKGGEQFDRKFGFPGVYYSKNITPYGIGRYSDGELYRAITTGVTKEGKALFPVMPYLYYGKMDPEDIRSIIAYLRALPPISNDVPASVSDFPMNFIVNLIPQKARPQSKPPATNKQAYGAYLVNAAGCKECHTKDNRGQIIEALAFSGGRVFPMPGSTSLTSPNITPDVNTGIGSWTEEDFIRRFKAFSDSGYTAPSVAEGAFNTIMPWTMYAKMTNEDLGAIYTYLKSLPAKENRVVKFIRLAQR